MPLPSGKKIAWFEEQIDRLLKKAYRKRIPDAAIAEMLKGLLEAHQMAAQAVLEVLQDSPEEEEDGGPDYFG